MRQELEEAPRGRRGHPGGRRDSGRRGVGWDPEAPRDEGERAEGEGWGWGEGFSPLSPLAPGAGAPALPGRAFCSRCGERPSGHCGSSFSQTRTHASPAPTRTLALTHSLTLPYTPTERQLRTTAGASSERGGRGLSEHGRGCRKNVAKVRAPSDPPSIPLRRGGLPPPERAPGDQVQGTR